MLRRSHPRSFLLSPRTRKSTGIDIQKAQELRGYDAVTHIANVPEFIKSVVNLRGIIVLIIAMHIKFNLGTPTYDQFTVIVILNIDGHVMGMVVDSHRQRQHIGIDTGNTISFRKNETVVKSKCSV